MMDMLKNILTLTDFNLPYISYKLTKIIVCNQSGTRVDVVAIIRTAHNSQALASIPMTGYGASPTGDLESKSFGGSKTSF